MIPLNFFTIKLLILKPRPIPFVFCEVFELSSIPNILNNLLLSDYSMPYPESMTSTFKWVSLPNSITLSTLIIMTPSRFVYLRALFNKLSKTWLNRFSSEFTKWDLYPSSLYCNYVSILIVFITDLSVIMSTTVVIDLRISNVIAYF